MSGTHHWKAHLDHLIADGELAAYLESRETLDALLLETVDERWRIISARDERLERLSEEDYQSLLRSTSVLRTAEVVAALSHESTRWDERLQQQNHLLTAVIDRALARLRLFLLVFSLGLFILLVARSDSPFESLMPTAGTEQSLEDLTRVVKSFQSRWNELLDQRSQEIAKMPAFPLGQAPPPQPTHLRTAWLTGLGVFLVMLAFLAGLRTKARWRLRRKHWLKFRQYLGAKPTADAPQDLSTTQWGERLERRSDDLMSALESSQTQINTRLEQVLHEASERQERQREFLWRVRALEEMGLKLIEGAAFHAELTALRAVWSGSAVLGQLDPAAVRGLPSRPLLLVTLEHLYGDLLIEREEQELLRDVWWHAWAPWMRNRKQKRTRAEEISRSLSRALDELRRGNWDAGIDELTEIEYLPLRRWAATAHDRLDLEHWYAELRQELWAEQSSATRPKPDPVHQCARTCRVPFCKPGKLCVKELLTRFRRNTA